MTGEDKTLDELESQAAELRKNRSVLFDQIKKLRDERDRLNESVKRLRDEAQKHRDERDKINARVREVKEQLGPLFEELDAKKDKLSETENALKNEYRNKPSKSKVERDLRRIEWEVMTTPTRQMLDREDELIARASSLSRTLEELKSLEKAEDKKMEYMADKKATELEIRSIRDEMQSLSEQSQQHHEKMIAFYDEADEEKKKADEAHSIYVKKIEEVSQVKDELAVIMPQLQALKDGVRISELKIAEGKKMTTQQRMEEMKQEAIKKMENGQKLTFDDLRLIYGDEDEEDEQDES
jgi:uncharacterized coiled-coil DUF342 family protein